MDEELRDQIRLRKKQAPNKCRRVRNLKEGKTLTWGLNEQQNGRNGTSATMVSTAANAG